MDKDERMTRAAEMGPVRMAALRRAKAYRRWGRETEEIFFDELAQTANITHAAQMAGKTTRSARYRRRVCPDFAARWLEALSEGYAMLELLMLNHALHGVDRVETMRDAKGKVKQEKTVRSYPHIVAMRLLQAHREEVERYRAIEMTPVAHDPASVERIRAEMARIRIRLTGPDDDMDDDPDDDKASGEEIVSGENGGEIG